MVILHAEPLPHHLQLKEMFCSVISLRLRTAIFLASLCSFTCAHALRHLSLRKKRQRREDVVLKSPGSWGGEGVENRWKETEKKVGGRGRRRKKKKTSRDFLQNNAIATNGDRPMSLHNFFDWTGPCRSCYQLPPDSKSIPWRNLPGARALSAIPMYTGCKWCWADVTLEKPRPSARAHVCETNMRVFVRWRGKLFLAAFN